MVQLTSYQRTGVLPFGYAKDIFKGLAFGGFIYNLWNGMQAKLKKFSAL